MPVGDDSQVSGRQSPKPTLLRDQHLPGETLHRRTAFPADIHMRHEAACANPLTAQQESAATGSGIDRAQSVGFAELHRQTDSSLRQTNPSDMPGQDAMQQKTHSTHQQPVSSLSASSPSGMQVRAAHTMPNPHTRAESSTAVHSNSLSKHNTSPSAKAAHVKAAIGSTSSHEMSPSAHAAFSRTANGRLEGNMPAKAQGFAAELWFEATTHDLARNKSWAREWLAMGMQEDQPYTPESAALLQNSAALQTHLQQTEHQQPAQQELQHLELQHLDVQPLVQQYGQLSLQPPFQTTLQSRHSSTQTEPLTSGQHSTALKQQSVLFSAQPSSSPQFCSPRDKTTVPES